MTPTDLDVPDLIRFLDHCERDGDCLIWTGSLMWKGYGMFSIHGRRVRAHRLAYQLVHGAIDPRLHVDHLCRRRRCVNPDHLEAVTPAENLRRSPIAPATINAAKTHCPHGHPYDEANTQSRLDGRRRCRACARDAARRRLDEDRELINARRRERRAARRTR